MLIRNLKNQILDILVDLGLVDEGTAGDYKEYISDYKITPEPVEDPIPPIEE